MQFSVTARIWLSRGRGPCGRSDGPAAARGTGIDDDDGVFRIEAGKTGPPWAFIA